MEKDSVRAENSRAGNFSPVKRTDKAHVIEMEFQPGMKSELEQAQWLCFQWNKILVPIARAF